MARYKSVHTGPQIDSGVARALPGGIIDQMRPNRNLLDNWDFRNPVNQRGGHVVLPGTASYWDEGLANPTGVSVYQYESVTVNGSVASFISGNAGTVYVPLSSCVRGYTGNSIYTIDRWFIAGGTLSIEDGYCSFISGLNEHNIQQYLEKPLPVGVTATYSAIVEGFAGAEIIFGANGYYYNAIAPDNSKRLVSVTFQVVGTQAQTAYIKSTPEGKIYAVKLELGSVSTLANDPPADYGIELLKCQRYFQTFKTQPLRPTDYRDFRPIMRTNPVLSTITVGADTLYTASADL